MSDTPHDHWLSADELASLRLVARDQARGAIPAAHQQRLTRLGFIRPVLDTVLLTATGAKRLVLGPTDGESGTGGT